MSDGTQIEDTSGEQLDFEDLDNFSSSFFGQKKDAPEEPAKPSDESEEKDDTSGDVITEVDEDETDDPEDTEDHDDQEEADKQEPEGKKPSRSQQRITELNTKYREAERREQALLQRLEALENGSKTEAPKSTGQVVDTTPTPADQNEDGTDKYPLGEFDPGFIRDLTKHTIAEAQKEAAETRSQTEAQERMQREAEALHNEWKQKEVPAKERYPDYGERVASLEDVFADVDPQYGEYLAQTVMAMDKGPDVLYYLSNHPDEARSIIKSGGVKAVIQLGRLESRFLGEDKPQPKPKVSSAPTPPPQNKGSAGGKRSVSPDTDDLDAFANEFFKKRK